MINKNEKNHQKCPNCGELVNSLTSMGCCSPCQNMLKRHAKLFGRDLEFDDEALDKLGQIWNMTKDKR